LFFHPSTQDGKEILETYTPKNGLVVEETNHEEMERKWEFKEDI